MRGSVLVAAALLAAPMVAMAAAGADKSEVKTADFSFSHAFPSEAAAIAPLRAFFEKERATLRAEITREAAEGRRSARRDKFEFYPYEASTVWQVVTSTPRLLSLSQSSYRFTGGAHGSTVSGAMIWDKTKQVRLAPVALFTSPAALWAAIRGPYCKALDAERLKRRGGQSDSVFGDCPPLKDLTLLLGSSNRRAIDRIGLVADAYVAGPYVEGAYEITLPVTPAIIAAVSPAYRDAFEVKR